MTDTVDMTTRAYERQMIDRARVGDRSAVCELVDQHKDRLYSFVKRMIHNHHDAEEICQDAFLKAFASLQSFNTDYRFSTWIFTIAYRVSLNHLRRKRALTGEMDFSTLPRDEAPVSSGLVESEEASLLREQVWSAVNRLSSPQRAAMILFYRHESSCHEIARILGVPVATVKSHLHRARNRLRELLQPVTEKDLDFYRNNTGLAG